MHHRSKLPTHSSPTRSSGPDLWSDRSPAVLAEWEGPPAAAALRVQDPNLVIESGGRMRAFTGRAYLPALVPSGVPLGDILFYGRSVYTAFEQRSTSSGAGPYFAYQAFP